jgi:class 3 adenylate cyclase/predicted ATPase
MPAATASGQTMPSQIEPPALIPEPSEAAPIPLEGERRLATVLVADVTGSTELLERIGTEAWVETMNQVLRRLEAEVYRFGGQVDQFRGDGLVAFFGATAAHEDDPERSVLSALAMQLALGGFVAESAAQQGFELQLRVGVNTGEVIVTSVGDSRMYRENTAMGEAVTIAARLESAAEPGTVLVSESTYRLAEPHFEWQRLAEIAVKGLRKPIAVYRPLGPTADTSPAYGLPVPLIGRDTEYQNLLGCVKDLFAGRGAIAVVMGEKGMGKTFLVNDVRQHFARRGALLAEAYDAGALPSAALTWLRGRCRSFDQSWPYSMWLSLWRSWLGIRRGEPKEAVRDRLRRQASELWGDRLPEYYAYLATFLSLPLEEPFAEQVRHLDAEGLRQQFFPTIRAWIVAMAQNGPLVMQFSDMQWADTTSLELLRYCLPLCDEEALLWLLVYRPERGSPVWEFSHYIETEYPHRITSIALSPLTDTESGAFIDELIGAEALPNETRDLVISKAEGNPYYIGELIRSLIAQGALAQDAATGKWRATRPVDSLDLPDSLQNLLLARIDRLLPDERYVLQMAAVIGSVFWSGVLEALADDKPESRTRALDAERSRDHLTALQREQLIHERGLVAELGMEYVISSNLIRDVAYESLLSAQQVVYHKKVAEYLEHKLSERSLPQFYGVLAFHYRHAGELPKELLYTLLAAEQAQRIYANVEAVEYYTRALKILEEMGKQVIRDEQLYAVQTQRLEVLNGRRRVYYLLGDFGEARADAESMLHLARQLPDEPVWLIDALLQQPGVVHWQTREELESGFILAEEALSLALDLGDRRREMQCLVAIAKQRLWVNDPTAWELAQRALHLARELGDQQYEVDILSSMGQVYAWTDHPDRGMAYLEEALPISRSMNDKMAEMRLIELIGLQFEREGDYHRLLADIHQERLRISREIGHRPVEADALMDCGQIQAIYLGDYDGGLELLADSLRIWEGTPSEAVVLLRMGQVLSAQGNVINEQAVVLVGHAGLRLVRAKLYNALGDVKHLEHVLFLCEETRQLVMNAPLTRQYEMAAACEACVAHLALAQHSTDEVQRQEHLQRALAYSEMAVDIYRQFGFVQIIECVSEEILFRHSEALAANGRGQEADPFLQQAFGEMMRKHQLIPAGSPFCATYLENIELHREIAAAVQPDAGSEGRISG